MLKLLIERAYKILDGDKDVCRVRILVTNNSGRIGYRIGVSNLYIDIIKIDLGKIDLERREIIGEVASDELENNLKHFRSISFYEERYSDIKI